MSAITSERAVGEADVTERTDERTAIRLYIRAIRMDPEASVAFYRLGRLFMKQGRGALAVRALRYAVELLPDHDQQRLQYARALRLNGQEDAAQREANYVLARNPNNEDAQRVLINHQKRGPNTPRRKP